MSGFYMKQERIYSFLVGFGQALSNHFKSHQVVIDDGCDFNS